MDDVFDRKKKGGWGYFFLKSLKVVVETQFFFCGGRSYPTCLVCKVSKRCYFSLKSNAGFFVATKPSSILYPHPFRGEYSYQIYEIIS